MVREQEQKIIGHKRDTHDNNFSRINVCHVAHFTGNKKHTSSN